MSLSAPLDEVFPFFSRAHNLNELTPPSLPFRILTPEPIEMAEELLIEYRLRVKGMPVRWTSEISVWNPPHRFVDEQKRGPYRWWHHEHVFEPTDGGTIARDVVHYGVLGGALVHSLVVKRDLMTIFTYRHRKMIELFGLLSPQPNNPS
ncbi:MAG: SRPBCC family protein [Phycisphaeraceae bacterium]|nr:SRPBCC family protein [Phycisphaeraceae bacterium]